MDSDVESSVEAPGELAAHGHQVPEDGGHEDRGAGLLLPHLPRVQTNLKCLPSKFKKNLIVSESA